VTLSRAWLAAADFERLRAGGRRKPRLLRIREDGRECVVKDFAELGGIARRLGAWLVRRELRAYERLAGHPAVPRVVGRIDDLAFAIEYRPGAVMGTGLAGSVPAGFIPALREAVREMHARGVVHLDLRHRSNVLAGEGGRPVLIDFASAVCFRPGGAGARLLQPLLAWIDRRAVDKWERQVVHGRR
jgi:hypothetical protein